MSKTVIHSMLRGTLQSIFRINNVALKVASGVLQVRNNADTADAPIKASALQLSSGAGAGRVLVSDASGNAAWTDGYTPPSTSVVGEVKFLAHATVPSGWVECYGQALSRTTYAALFAAIGTKYGTGDGSTTFNVPYAKRQFIAGFEPVNGGEFDFGHTGGEETHVLTTTEMPAHTHTVPRVNTVSAATTSFARVTDAATVSQINSGSTGGGAAHENRPPWIVLLPIIYTGV